MEKPLSQRAAADVKNRLRRMPKRLGALQKPRMKAGFSFALLLDSQPPAGGLRCLALGFFPNVIFRCPGGFGQSARRLQFSLPVVSKSARQNVRFSPEDILSASVVLFGIWCFQNDRNGPFPRQSRLVKFPFATPLCRAFCDYRLHVGRFIGKIHSFGNSNPWRKCLSGPSFRFSKYVYRRKFCK